MTHDWYRPRQYVYPICRICGVVKRTDGKNKPCKGPTKLRPMEGEDAGPKDQNEQAWEDLRADGGLPEARLVHNQIFLCGYAYCKGHGRPEESCVP